MNARGIALTFSTALLSSFSFASGLKETASKINAATISALKKSDIVAFDKAMKPWVTSDFKYYETGKSMTYKQMVDEMKLGMAQMKHPKTVEVTGVKIVEKGDTGTTMGVHHMVGQIVGQDNKPHTMDWTAAGTEVWVKTKSGWKMKSLTFANQKMLLDGKKMGA